MNDPMQRIANGPQGSGLFNQKSTSTLAGEQAASKSGLMRQRILNRLRKSPAALFEIAAEMGVPDHIISGRFHRARPRSLDRADRNETVQARDRRRGRRLADLPRPPRPWLARWTSWRSWAIHRRARSKAIFMIARSFCSARVSRAFLTPAAPTPAARGCWFALP